MIQQNREYSSSDNQGHWRAHVKALSKSGLSRAEYCRRQNLSYHAMIYWQKKLARSTSDINTLVPISIDMGREQVYETELQVNLPSGLSIEIGNNFSPRTLSRLLTTLEAR